MIELIHIEEQTLVGRACPQHHDSGIGHTLHDIGVCHHTDRNVIQEDVFIAFTQLCNQILKTRAHQQLSWVGRHRAGEDDVKIGRTWMRVDDVVDAIRFPRQVIGNARPDVDAKHLEQCSLTNIQVNDDGLSCSQRETGRQISRNKGLTR